MNACNIRCAGCGVTPKITAPFHERGVAPIHLAMPFEEAIKVKLKKL